MDTILNFQLFFRESSPLLPKEKNGRKKVEVSIHDKT